jgi:hypothetical protein
MKSYRSLILVLLVLATAAALSTMRGQSQNSSTKPNQDNLKKAAEDFYPITDYDAPEPADPQKRALRQIRARRYNMRAQKGVDPKRFMITEERESSFGLPPSHAPNEPALPAAESDAIVIGRVTQAEAYLTEDKTYVHSEFTTRVDDVLKNTTDVPLVADDSLDAIRSGGGVRFPSGKLIRYGIEGRPHPRIGQQYLFFLKYDSEQQAFVIVTAYELRAGQVFPLDGTGIDGKVLEPYAAYQKYVGADEQSFLNEVKQAIANAPVGGGQNQ